MNSIHRKRALTAAGLVLLALGLAGCAPAPAAYVNAEGEVVTAGYPYYYDDDLLWGSYYLGLGIALDDDDWDGDNSGLSDAEREQILDNAGARQDNRADRRDDIVNNRPPEGYRPSAGDRPNVRPPSYRPPNVSRPSGGNRPSGGGNRPSRR